jgi:hypothetical protein
VFEAVVVLAPAGDGQRADAVVLSELLDYRGQPVAVGAGDLVHAVQEESEPALAEPDPADRGRDLVPAAEFAEQPADEAGEQRAVGRVVALMPGDDGPAPAGQIHQHRDRPLGVVARLFGQRPGEVEQQCGLAGTGRAEDQHRVLQIVEHGRDVGVLADLGDRAVQRLDEQVVRTVHRFRPLVQRQGQAGTGG